VGQGDGSCLLIAREDFVLGNWCTLAWARYGGETEKKNLEEERDDEVEDVVLSTLLLSSVLRGRVRIKDRSREQNP
jgi:hypothetical protein